MINMTKQDQEEKKHACKLCNKSFSSGKVLGGHMRSHTAERNLTKRAEKKLNKKKMKMKNIINNMGCEAEGYGLRENPKKSWKIFGSEEGVSEQENACKICGKEFGSMRALFGHMRHHSGKQRRKGGGVGGFHCKECDQEFESLGAVNGHMKSHNNNPETILVSKESASISTHNKLFVESQYSSENSGLIRKKKRSRRMRYKISPNSSFANLSEHSLANESEQEVVEVAVTLLMLSRGVRNRDGFGSATESSDNNSATFEVKSPNQTQTVVVENGGEGDDNDDDDECFKLKKLRRVEKSKCCLYNPEIAAFGGKKVAEFSENDSGFISGEGKKVKLEVSIDRLYNRMPNLDEVELDENFTEEIGLDPAGLGSMKSTSLSKKTRIESSPLNPSSSEIFDDSCSRRKSEYRCRICNKVFHSHQALGGHQKIHRIGTKNCNGLLIDDHPESLSNTKTFTEAEADDSMFDKSEFHKDPIMVQQEVDGNGVTVTSCESKEYKCAVCFKAFASGQALGGHKRAHFAKDEQINLLNQELSNICDEVIGLDVRVEDEEAKADVELNSWWVKNNQNHELLLGLIPNWEKN